MQFVADIVFLPPLLMKCYCVTSFSDVLQLIEGTARSHHHIKMTSCWNTSMNRFKMIEDNINQTRGNRLVNALEEFGTRLSQTKLS